MYNFKVLTLIEQGRVNANDIGVITDWISDVDLPKIPDELAALFLMSCDGDINKTKSMIKVHFKIKKKAPGMFDDRDIDTNEELKRQLEVVCCADLPVRTADNSAIHYFRLIDTNYSHADLETHHKMGYMLADVTQYKNPPDGLIVLFDMAGIGFMHLTLFRLSLAKSFLSFLQEGFPMKLKSIYILNSNYLLDKILGIVKMLLNTDILAMIQPFPPGIDIEEFFKNHIPAHCMPKDYGGLLPSTDELHRVTIRQFRELKPFFEAEEAMRKMHKYKSVKKL